VRRRRAGIGAGIVFAFVLPARARADDAGARAVVAEKPACVPAAWAKGWAELLRVELAGDGIDVRAGAGDESGARVHVEGACDAAATEVTLAFASGDRRETRKLSLAGTDAVARSRVVAIAMADLVRAAMADAKAKGATAAAPMTLDVRVHVEERAPAPAALLPPAGIPAAATAADSRRAMLGVWVAGETRLFAQGSGLFGGRLGLELPLSDHVAVVVDGAVAGGEGSDPLGTIDATLATVGGSLLAMGGSRDVVFGAGARVEGGAVWLRGEASSATTAATSATSGFAFLGVSGLGRFRVDGSLWALVGGDVGWTVYGFSGRADERHVADLVGAEVAVRVGFAWGGGRQTR
jgi:hypothetical protein